MEFATAPSGGLVSLVEHMRGWIQVFMLLAFGVLAFALMARRRWGQLIAITAVFGIVSIMLAGISSYKDISLFPSATSSDPSPKPTPTPTPAPSAEPAQQTQIDWGIVGIVVLALFGFLALIGAILFMWQLSARRIEKMEKEKELARKHAEFMQEALDSAIANAERAWTDLERYQTDLELNLKAPLLSLLTDPETQEVTLMAANMRELSRKTYDFSKYEVPAEIPFIEKSREFVMAYENLKAKALRDLPEGWTEKEASLVEQAIALLAKAKDERNHVAERQTAYERVFKIMEKLHIPPRAEVVWAIEKSQGLQLALPATSM